MYAQQKQEVEQQFVDVADNVPAGKMKHAEVGERKYSLQILKAECMRYAIDVAT